LSKNNLVSQSALVILLRSVLTDKIKLDAQPELFVHLVSDKENKTLSITDGGISMTKAVRVLLSC
jgi:HSP90 family molecular chaperone